MPPTIWKDVAITNVNADQDGHIPCEGLKDGCRRDGLSYLQEGLARLDDRGRYADWFWNIRAIEPDFGGVVMPIHKTNIPPPCNFERISRASILPSWGDLPCGGLSIFFELLNQKAIWRNIAAHLSAGSLILRMHFFQLTGDVRIGLPEKVGTYSGSNDQQDGRYSQDSSVDAKPPRPAGYERFIYAVMIWISGCGNAALGMMLIIFGFSDRHRVVASCVGMILLGLGGFMGWTGAAVLSRLETPITSSAHLTSADRHSENIGVLPIVIPELKLCNVQGHIFGTHLVESANNAAFEDRPETLNRIGMNRADDVLLAVVIDRLVIVFGQAVVNPAFVSGEQANLVGNHLAHESLASRAGNVSDHSRDHLPLRCTAPMTAVLVDGRCLR